MTPDAIAGRVNRIVADCLGVDDNEAEPLASLRGDLNADAGDLFALANALAAEFAGDPDRWEWALGNCHTVADVAAWVEARVGAGVRP